MTNCSHLGHILELLTLGCSRTHNNTLQVWPRIALSTTSECRPLVYSQLHSDLTETRQPEAIISFLIEHFFKSSGKHRPYWSKTSRIIYRCMVDGSRLFFFNLLYERTGNRKLTTFNYVGCSIHVTELLCHNWRFANFWLEIWSHNWRFFIDIFIDEFYAYSFPLTHCIQFLCVLFEFLLTVVIFRRWTVFILYSSS